MSLVEAIARFRELHLKHKGKLLSLEESARYLALRDDFERALVSAQRLAVRPGQAVRQAVRVATAMKLVFKAGAHEHKTVTLDVGPRGFAALLGAATTVGASVEFALGGAEPVRGRARVVACDRYGSGGVSFRASFAIESITDADRARLEDAVIDAALAALTR